MTTTGGAEADGESRVRLGISSCLLGEEVRYDGGHKRDRFLVHTLGQWVDWHAVCPEVEVGMGTPRESIRLVGLGSGAPEAARLVGVRSGTDHTDAMRLWSRERLEEIATWGLDGYVLKRASPSCGLFRVKIYPAESGMPRLDGRGIFAQELAVRLPTLPLEEEGRLSDPGLRENFVERIFAHHRWRRWREGGESPGGLVRFHTAQKLVLLAHSPEHYQRLGRLVAEAGSRDVPSLCDEYARLFFEALGVLATRGRHVNVLQHVLGFLKEQLAGADKEEMLAVLEEYRGGLVPLVVPLTLLRHHLRRHEVPEWLRVQTYLNPYPRELMLRNHV